MHTTQPSIQSFLDYLKFQKRYSRHTLLSYENDLSDFFLFIQSQYEQTGLKEIKPAFIRTWLAQLKGDGMTSKTINRKISALKSFFKFHLKKGAIEVSPMTTIVSLKQNKRLPHFVDKKDTATLFEVVEFSDDWNGKTEKLILELLYHTGIRQAELIGLKQSQIDWGKAQIKVLGKGGKERIIPVHNELLVQLKEYVSDKVVLACDTKAPELLVRENGKSLYPKLVYNVVKKYLSLVTTIEKRSPHVLRHTFATHLTNNGADLNAVKELLGHSSLAATQIYTHNSIEKLKDIYKKAHPKA